MGYTVNIRDNETGKIVKYQMPSDCNWDDEGSKYLWSEGNFSCDCNRYLFFQRALSLPEDDEECGDGRYSVNIPEHSYEEF